MGETQENPEQHVIVTQVSGLYTSVPEVINQRLLTINIQSIYSHLFEYVSKCFEHRSGT